MPNDIAIHINNLTKSFKDLHILKGINLEIKKGTVFAILGPNGAGKTTTVRILSTLLDPDGGEIFVNGFDVVSQADEVRKVIGLTGQYAAIDEYLTGRENLEMMGQLYHLSKKESKIRAKELLEEFDLMEASERPAKTYSGGMRRRLDLAASLVATPPIIFLDEPTTGLDPRSRISMWKIIENLKKKGITILLTTQYLEEADKLADMIAVIDQGKVIALGTADELKDRVGKNRLELNFIRREDFTKAKEVINDKYISTNEDENSITITMETGSKEVKKILDKMEEIGVEVESMSLHKPTLDDVFLLLTGHEMEHNKTEKNND
ncbi:MAG TPA: ATP-binding cassette domain-containing protein [Candidatus Paceibacterota bacterium]|nr:ATP-binding cassette domain-containing protein [Candidatus Paceibacterota bacterium]